MKNSPFVLCLFVVCCYSCGKPYLTLPEIQAKEAAGFGFLETDPKQAIKNFVTVAQSYHRTKAWAKESTTYLNVSNIYDEWLGDNKKALLYAKKSLSAAERANDTLQIANLSKYACLLEGRLHHFVPAERHAKRAIELYTAKQFPAGVAVSRFDWANALYEKKAYPEALAQLGLSKAYWATQGDNTRLFAIYTLELLTLYRLGKSDEVQSLFHKCEAIKSGGTELPSILESRYKEALLVVGLAESRR